MTTESPRINQYDDTPHLQVCMCVEGGFRVMFVAANHYELLGKFATMSEAQAARRSAEAARAAVARVFG